MQVLALLHTPRAHHWLRRNAERLARVTVVDSQASIDATLQRARIDVLVLELDIERGSLEPLVWDLRRRYPSLAIVLYCPLSSRVAREILTLGKAGADDLIVEGLDDDGRSLRRIAVTAASSRCTAQSLAALKDRLPARVMDIVARCLHLASQPTTVRQLAAAVGVNRKTLVNRLTAAGLPGPAALISWCRVLLACELLQDPGRSVEQVALALGFGSAVALRNMSRRYLRVRPSELRSRDALDVALHRLLAGELRRSTPHRTPLLAHAVTAH